ncbi:GntR family transcriptional regulator [Bordetella petrii]|uniref:GntR family transcriptional regulator n=1 Tax=Bordetella petrii TaxID=94624 RepID=UPI001E575F7E|nr:GntR family transcriptional regulator [Bordetella petrii]MCD0504806.1 GntR family transcriptional regulator [Bordetella petrii]
MALPADPDVPLDRSSGHPLHVQVAQALRQDIHGRQLPPGTVLPSEAILCRQFGVARSVIRQALAALVSEGLIRRDPGRAPTVAPPVEHHRMVQRSTGLFEQFASTGTTLRTRVLRFEATEPPAEVAAFFGSGDTLLLERLRRVDAEPLAFVRTWLPRARLQGLAASHLQDTSLHRTLVQRFGLRPGRGRNRIRAVGADALLADALQVPEGSPLLMLEGQGFDQHGQALEWFTTWHRAEKLVFDVDVTAAGEHIHAALPGESAAMPARSAVPAQDPSLDSIEASLLAALETVRKLRRGGSGT